MSNQLDTIAHLREFVVDMTNLVSRESEEPILISKGSELLKTLIQTDSWLPEFCTIPHPEFYQQYLLHVDPLERFSIVSFVWGPGQKTPVHDHCTWGLIGMLRGAEKGQRFKYDANGKLIADGPETLMQPGDIEQVSPTVGDIHIVSNAFQDEISISIHVYGANIGAVKRHVYNVDSGEVKNFISGYSSTQVPNLWDRSTQIRAQLN